jgi:serine protease
MKKIFLLAFSVMIAATTYSQSVHPDYWDGVVYFKFKDGSGITLPAFEHNMDASEVYQRFPVFSVLAEQYEIYQLICPFRTKTETIQNIYRIKFLKHDMADELIKALLTINEVEYAEKSPILRHFLTVNDPDTAQQYYLSKINAYQAWDLSTGDSNVKIAIVDDAVRVTHPDLTGNIWVNPLEIPGNGIDDDGNGYIDDVSGWDAADNDNDPNAPLTPPIFWGELAYTHGTHCSGLAAGVTNNGIGIASVSHNVSLIPVKAVSDNSWLPIGIEAPAEGLDYAITAGADIVSMSFGGEDSGGFSTLENLINAGHDLGIIFVAAAGNNGDGSSGFGTPNAINYPAGFTNVIAVGATNSSDLKPGFSQYGTWIDVMAPGVGIYSTLAWSSPYGNQDGTSMACPIVAGVLGLMKSYQPHATKEQLIFCLKQGADDIDALNPDFAGEMGAGRVNAYNSLVCLQQYQSIYIHHETGITLFPNPASEKLQIGFADIAQRTVKIFNINGVVVESFTCNEPVAVVNVSGLSAGMYVCMVEENGNVSSHRFIVQR